jgi:hypothetical protein
MKNNLEQITKRTRQYWFSDGFVEIVNGVIFLLLGVYFYVQYSLPSGSLWLFLLQAGFVILLIGAIFLGGRLVNILKTRFTYPRTGYIGFRTPPKANRWISAGLALLMVILLLALFNATPISLNWLPATTGFIIAAFWLISAARVRVLRFYFLAVMSMILGAGLSFAHIGVLQGIAAYYSGMGLILIGSGGLTLAKYLRQSPEIDENPAIQGNS